MNPWERLPRPVEERRIEIATPEAGPGWTVEITSDRLAQLDTHFDGEKTLACLTPWGMECLGCKKGRTARLEGYAGVYNHAKKVDQVVRLTEGAVEQLIGQLGERVAKGQLRGTLLLLQRTGATRRTPLKVSWAGDIHQQRQVRLDVPLILCRAWGMPLLLEKWRALLAAQASAAAKTG